MKIGNKKFEGVKVSSTPYLKAVEDFFVEASKSEDNCIFYLFEESEGCPEAVIYEEKSEDLYYRRTFEYNDLLLSVLGSEYDFDSSDIDGTFTGNSPKVYATYLPAFFYIKAGEIFKYTEVTNG